MANIFELEFMKDAKISCFGEETSIEKRKYKTNDYFFCDNCKKAFASLELMDKYNGKNYYDVQNFCLENPKRVLEKIHCPHCYNSSTFKDIKKIDTDYQLFNGYRVNGDKINIHRKYIIFKYYRGRVVPFIIHSMLVINMRTGQSYRLADLENGKILSRREPRILNTTYATRFRGESSRKYSDKCISMQEIVPEIYNTIRQYKIDNNLVSSHIPTFEQNNNHFINDPESPFRYLNKGIFVQLLPIFNRFPCLNISDSVKLFFYHEEENKNKSFIKIRRNIKQGDSQVIKTILDAYDIPFTKSNKTLLLEKGMCYLTAYNEFKNLIDINNFYKIAKVGLIMKKDVLEFFKMFNLTKQQENNFCNKIYKSIYAERPYIIRDTFRMVNAIKKTNPEYSIDFKLSIKEMHDLASKDYCKLTIKNVVIDYSHFSKGIDNFNFAKDGYTFKLAEDVYELLDIGSYMHICVGSYGNKALRHDCWIVAVRDENNNPVACIELCLDGDIRFIQQAKTKYNYLPDIYIGKIIEEWAELNNIEYRRDKYKEEELNCCL